jgi:GH25 family lysozyme M1 (1,4-beta-N-acetylmuramidase)
VIVAASGVAALAEFTGSAGAKPAASGSAAALGGPGQAAGAHGAGPATMQAAASSFGGVASLPAGRVPPADITAMNQARHFPRLITSSPAGRVNVALPHSPQLLHELSGPLNKTGRPGHAGAPVKSAVPAQPAAPAPSRTAPAPGSTTASPAPSTTATANPAPGRTATATATASPAPGRTAGPNRAAVAAPAATAGASATSATLPQGVDVASFQHPKSTQYPNGHPIDWTQVAGAGNKFAFIKATEGDYYVNPYYASDVAAAKTAGLYVSGYHFGIPNAGDGAVNQADYAVKNGSYTADGHTLPLMLDIEYDPNTSFDGTSGWCYGLTSSQLVSWITAFDDEAQRLTGQAPIIYTTADWWKTCAGNSSAFASDQLWIASYSASSPLLPTGWSNWMFWQYTSGGTVPGITVKVDEDYFNSNRVELIAPGTQRDLPGATVSPLQVNSLNAAAGQSLSYASSGLPAGLSISSSTGQITGSVSAAPGAYKVNVTATNSTSGASGSVGFIWEVPGTVTVTPTSQSTTIGSPADYQVPASDTAAGYSPSFTATGLPPGVSISSTGRISGWPTTAGTYSATVTGTDAMNVSGSATFSWTVSPASAQGPAGQVWLQNGGKCLDDPNGSTASGTRLQVWRCLGNTNQRWTVVQDGTLRINGACLAEAGTGNGAAVVLNVCDGTSAQRWQVGTNGQLANTASGRCLDDPGWQTANGTLVQTWSCAGGANQHWIPAAAAAMPGIPGKCIDDPGFNTTNGIRLDIWDCTGGSGGGNEHVTVEPDGSIQLLGKCIDVAGASTASGAWIDLYTCKGSSNQHWKIVPDGSLGSQVVNPASGKCLADTGGAMANGSKLTLQSCPPLSANDPGTTWHVL